VDTQAVDPPSTHNAFVGDGKWHRFGESTQTIAPADPAASPRSSVLHSTPSVYVGDGKWHHFGERGDSVAANRDGANLAAALKPSLTRVAMEPHFRGVTRVASSPE
jgi:hypothetical protein